MSWLGKLGRGRAFGVAGVSLVICSGVVLTCARSSSRPPPAAVPSAARAAPSPSPREKLASLLLRDEPLRPDRTNRYADDPRAAALGQRFFFDSRFSGPLLDDANDGNPGTLGRQGESGKVACASCHMPQSRAFVDVRSARKQLSLASGWTRRKTPSLLDSGTREVFTWDGRTTTFFGQVMNAVESSREFNSSATFVSQQVARYYRQEYEAVFGALAPLADVPPLKAEEAGCASISRHYEKERCRKPTDAQPEVMRTAVNFGKAIQAYVRRLRCGSGPFDRWLSGDTTALTAEAQAGAELFVGKARCVECHTGPHLTDERFHNVGLQGRVIPFTGMTSLNDPGASVGLAMAPKDPLNASGTFSDGDDGRQARLPESATALGAFRTPSLRCVTRRPTFMHDGQFRRLEAVLDFFARGGDKKGFVGTTELHEVPLDASEKQQLVAFLNALDGSGPDPAVLVAPALP